MGKPSIRSIRASLPRLKHHATNGRRMDTPDDMSQMLLEAGLVRDWNQGRKLIRRHKGDAFSLFWKLVKARRRRGISRGRRFLIRLTGGYLYDPHKRELSELDGFEGDARHYY